mmetsp:Transcript_52054/g.91433  ORF Transcript_52054/g.91433 Transcript_52054/m.91433 type:complete len:227 (-) Transcript_52054:448-1128(-)
MTRSSGVCDLPSPSTVRRKSSRLEKRRNRPSTHCRALKVCGEDCASLSNSSHCSYGGVGSFASPVSASAETSKKTTPHTSSASSRRPLCRLQGSMAGISRVAPDIVQYIGSGPGAEGDWSTSELAKERLSGSGPCSWSSSTRLPGSALSDSAAAASPLATEGSHVPRASTASHASADFGATTRDAALLKGGRTTRGPAAPAGRSVVLLAALDFAKARRHSFPSSLM